MTLKQRNMKFKQRTTLNQHMAVQIQFPRTFCYGMKREISLRSRYTWISPGSKALSNHSFLF